ncbi:ABC transporter permease [Microbacterium sp. SLBN-146]|uniref:ABC transporter permease n=1 Tax=Microbacterium sp. SLBN-146 TaxID=2768457 RepID=UPI00114EAE55|nr:ABC transporter permease [Microbacterium sp. SLBN-146]TQJ29858.1 peptide/nickel transport system permease protein [Microbacterium sp. SLBN-146]
MTLTQTEAAGGAITARGPVPGFGARARRGSWSVLAIAAQAATVFLIATFLTFALGAWSGSNPAAVALGDQATPEDIARLNAVYGLDQPLLVRYVDWLTSALTGDLGTAWFSGIPVAQSIAQAFPVSLSIAVGATLVAVVLGGSTGILAAVARGSWIDRGITAVCAVLATIPAFVAGIALILVFALAVPILPVGGYVPPTISVGAWLACLVLPSIALSLDAAADLSRQLRTSLVGSLTQNYVVAATVHGLGRPRIVLRHALPNALGPAVATLGLHVPRLVGGAVITEAVFGMPGLGMLARQAALSGDVPVVQGVLLVSIALVVASGIVVGIVLGRLGANERSTA